MLQNKKSKPLGHVTLVGAGPGDPDLLTIKAVKALQAADVVLFDALVSDDILSFIKAEAKTICVGKRGGKPSCKQDDIHAMLLQFARAGRQVVRLKSGDPMIFGRAGEELDMLEREGISTTVVSGITAAMAVSASTRTSLTHRDCAQSVKFITAHSRQGELPELDWQACADGVTTLMVYMGARTAPKLASKLMQAGASEDLPVLIAKGVSRTTESIGYVRLSQLTDISIDRTQPVLIGIGRVFETKCQAFEQGRNIQTFEGVEIPTVIRNLMCC